MMEKMVENSDKEFLVESKELLVENSDKEFLVESKELLVENSDKEFLVEKILTLWYYDLDMEEKDAREILMEKSFKELCEMLED